MLSEMGMSSIPSLLPIPKVQAAFKNDGAPTDVSLITRADKFFGELEWYANALKAAREKPCQRSECDTMLVKSAVGK
ncbi:hypothetical protein V1504DRAFT_433355 [Lipomyces starkeyi]